jgi:Flp pilus assembly protein TadD
MDMTETNEIGERKPRERYEMLRELGDCHTSVGNYNEAQQCYEKAASLGPDEPGPYVGLGVAALQNDKLDDAEIAFRVACRLDPGCAKAYAGLAMVCQQRQDFPQACSRSPAGWARLPRSSAIWRSTCPCTRAIHR